MSFKNSLYIKYKNHIWGLLILLPIPSHRRLLEVLIAGTGQERRVENAVDVLFTEKYFVWDQSAMLKDLINKDGCYVFKDKRGTILYVGETKDLYSRICKKHIRGSDRVSKSFYRFIYEIEVYVIDNSLHPKHGVEIAYGSRKTLEHILIKQLRPYRNWVKLGKFKSTPFFNYLRTFKLTCSRTYWPLIEKQSLLSAYGNKFKI